MIHLYEISEQHKALQLAIESDDLPAEAVADTFEALEGDFEEKAKSLHLVTKEMEGDFEAVDAEIKRLQARKKTMEIRLDWLRNYLRENMQATGINKISCPLFTITLAKGRDIVIIDNEDKIPTDYVDLETKVKPRKTDILKALKEGEDVPGCHIEKSKSSLRIT